MNSSLDFAFTDIQDILILPELIAQLGQVR